MKNIAVSDELHAVIKEIANKERRKINIVIEIAIENYIKANEDEIKES
jgi:predicted transcriptional regulator